jgi:hypothetical protein
MKYGALISLVLVIVIAVYDIVAAAPDETADLAMQNLRRVALDEEQVRRYLAWYKGGCTTNQR